MTGFLALGFDRIRRHAKVKCIAVSTIGDSWFFAHKPLFITSEFIRNFNVILS
jgi:hypothetical protein